MLELAAGSSATVDDAVTYKHLLQQSSILGHMQNRGLLGRTANSTAGSGRTFVEFGAGKGMMSLGVDAEEPGADLLLVERDSSSARTNADRVLKARRAGRFERLRIDIRDLDLARYAPKPEPEPERQGKGSVVFSEPVVGFSKHLCGVATDLTLRCLVNYHLGAGDDGVRSSAERCAPCAEQPGTDSPYGVLGVAIALCCHGLCIWDDYVGQEFWTDELRFSAEDFDRVKRFGSWATGARKKAAEEAAAAAATGEELSAASEQGEDEQEEGRLLEGWEMVEFGRQCKRLIDAGRLAYVRTHLPHLAGAAALLTYCDDEISPENCLLIA